MNADPVHSPLDYLDEAGAAYVARVVASAREYLGAQVSFLAEVVGSHKIVRETSGPAIECRIGVGQQYPVEDSYCSRVLSGAIPEVIYDTAADERALAIPLTSVLGVRSYMGVPIRMPDGRVLGTLCCINFDGAPERRARDLGAMHFLADLIGRHLIDAVNARDLRMRRRAAVSEILGSGGPDIVFQPIVALASGRWVGVEALARFTSSVIATPDVWFAQAWSEGLGLELELAAIQTAFAALAVLPDDLFLSVNAAPATLAHPRFMEVLAKVPADRVVVEITEHSAIEDYSLLLDATARLRRLGVRVAIDDVGAGYSSLKHVLRISPDISKLDISLIRTIDADRGKQAMAAGLTAYGARAGVMVVAEGVETEEEVNALKDAGVQFAQGYWFARPGPLRPEA